MCFSLKQRRSRHDKCDSLGSSLLCDESSTSRFWLKRRNPPKIVLPSSNVKRKQFSVAAVGWGVHTMDVATAETTTLWKTKTYWHSRGQRCSLSSIAHRIPRGGSCCSFKYMRLSIRGHLVCDGLQVEARCLLASQWHPSADARLFGLAYIWILRPFPL